MNPLVGVTDSTSGSSDTYKYHHLDPELVKQLVAIYRFIFPHQGVPNGFYEYVVRKLDDKAAQNEDLPRFLSEGIEALNGQGVSAWISLSGEASEPKRLPFFKCYDRTSSFISTVIPLFGPTSATKVHPTMKAVISTVVLTTSTGSKERSFSVCREHLIRMTAA